MAYLSENRLAEIIDIPVSLPTTELKMGDWVVVSSVKITTPMRLTSRFLNLQVVSSSVPVSNIAPSNYIFGNLGLVYLVLRKDYQSGSPGSSGGLDSIVATSLGTFSRDYTVPVLITDPGNYSWIIANNTQPSTDAAALVSPGTSIDFNVNANGCVRLELSYT